MEGVFTNTSTGNPNYYVWEFSDEDTVETSIKSQAQVHVFESYGDHNVCLISYVKDGAEILNSDTSCQTINIEQPTDTTCESSFSYTMDGLEGVFTNTSTGNPNYYLWIFDGTDMIKTNIKNQAQIHQFSTFGTHEVCLIAQVKDGQVVLNADTICKDFILIEPNTTSLANAIVSYKTGVKIYPNPANNILHITYSLINTDNVTINIYNINGILLKTEVYSDQMLEMVNHQIDISDLSRGLYVVKLSSVTISESLKFMILK